MLDCKIGDKFGEWVVTGSRYMKGGHSYVTVQCKCGKIQDLSLSDLKNGRAHMCKSCAARSRGPKLKIGDKNKHWIIIEGPLLRNGAINYKIKCDCGRSTRFISGHEFLNPNRSYMCFKCAGEKRGIEFHLQDAYEELYQHKYYKLQRGAEVRHIEFSLSKEYLWNLYVAQNKRCAITGDEIPVLSEASLDRIESNLGYIEGNVQWVTKQANLSKHIMTMKQLYDFCRKVLKHANQQPSTGLTTCEGSETNS
ncbi:MAG: hypothetical protein IJU02_07045 [Lachnospiraceae bacterium]|nr:hypothetical protein [Lachnospiraceae bacterium]